MHQPVITTEQQIVDREQLRLLALFHYVTGGVMAFTSLILLAYLIFGLAMAFGSTSDARIGGYIISTIFGACFVLGAAHSGLTIYAGRCIGQRKGRTFTLVMAALNCLNFPYGTILGVCTFMVLTRNSVKDAYDQARLGLLPGRATDGISPSVGGVPLKVTTASPPTVPPVSAHPFGSHDLHQDHAEEQMWKDLERKAAQGQSGASTAPSSGEDAPPSS